MVSFRAPESVSRAQVQAVPEIKGFTIQDNKYIPHSVVVRIK